jgi:cell division transport system ATP-binding protein
MATDKIVEFKNVPILQKEMLVLNNVNLSIKKGQFIFLIGKTGSGKSSLLKTIYGELPVRDGEASSCGYNLRSIKSKEVPFLRRKIGIVFQDFQLLTDRSINDNLLFVLKATGWTNKTEIEERINYVLEKVDLASKGHKMTHQVSGGEQQRVAIARALLNNPEIILADEPTGNLDPDTSTGIMRLLIEISKTGCSVFMATHNYNLIHKFPSDIVKCEDGKIISSGNETN